MAEWQDGRLTCINLVQEPHVLNVVFFGVKLFDCFLGPRQHARPHCDRLFLLRSNGRSRVCICPPDGLILSPLELDKP